MRTGGWDTVLCPRGCRDENREEYKRWQCTPATEIEIKLDSQIWVHDTFFGQFSIIEIL